MNAKKYFLWLAIFFYSGMISADYKTQKVLITSVPKCGTHLLARALQLLTNRPLGNLSFMNSGPDAIVKDAIPPTPQHEILLDHVQYAPAASEILKKRGFKGFFIYRDPRDQIVSMAFWILKNPDFYKEFGILRTSQRYFPDLITKLIHTIGAYYGKFLPWKKDPLFLTVRFEDLIGPKGGGSLNAQRNAVMALGEHLGMKLDRKKIDYVCSKVYGNTGTFRSGKKGSWKSYFNAGHKTLFKKVAGNLLIQLGYERNLRW